MPHARADGQRNPHDRQPALKSGPRNQKRSHEAKHFAVLGLFFAWPGSGAVPKPARYREVLRATPSVGATTPGRPWSLPSIAVDQRIAPSETANKESNTRLEVAICRGVARVPSGEHDRSHRQAAPLRELLGDEALHQGGVDARARRASVSRSRYRLRRAGSRTIGVRDPKCHPAML